MILASWFLLELFASSFCLLELFASSSSFFLSLSFFLLSLILFPPLLFPPYRGGGPFHSFSPCARASLRTFSCTTPCARSYCAPLRACCTRIACIRSHSFPMCAGIEHRLHVYRLHASTCAQHGRRNLWTTSWRHIGSHGERWP